MPVPVAIIPAYNSSGTIAQIILRVKSHIKDVLVIDDGSGDQTAELARSSNAIVISHQQNKGKGAALKTGFAGALARGFDPIITLDSDGQHNPDYIPSFIKAYHDTAADIIIGSRAKNNVNMPWDRKFSNWATSHILTFLLKKQIDDSQSGFRVYSGRFLKVVQFDSDHFELETEAIIKAANRGFAIKFIPISVEYELNFPTNINRLLDTLRWCRKVLEHI